MDFLNSTATPSEMRIEWLCNGADLIDWLEQAGVVPSDVAARFRADAAHRQALDDLAEQARNLREWLRTFLKRRSEGKLKKEIALELAPLNRWLAMDQSYLQVQIDGDDPRQPAFRQQRVRQWATPEQLLLPIAEAISNLICHADSHLIRECESSTCVLMFLDKTKAHARRWCSMALCGNRAKVAAHRARATKNRP